MFQFMRKADKSKNDKGGKHIGKESNKLSPDDLHRLDEIRRSFKLGKGKKDKLPSGIIADYSENFTNPLPPINQPYQFDRSGDGSSSRPIESESSESSLTSLSKGSPDQGEENPKSPSLSSLPMKTGLARGPPLVQRRKPSSRQSENSNLITTSSEQYLAGLNSSRPTTSASNSSFTPTYITPPQSPSHGKIHLGRFFSIPELELGEDVLPPIRLKPSVLRNVQVVRQPSGDFGFSLRRASVTHENGQEILYYAEPSQITSTLGYGAQIVLLPGDRLVSVNSTLVQGKNRDAVISLIRSSQESVCLQVLTNSIWAENVHGIDYQKDANLEENDPGIWVAHLNGFAGGQLIQRNEGTGKCIVQLDNCTTFEVCEDDIENRNPVFLDHIAELWNLQLINDSSILHILRNRYHSSLPFTLSTHQSLLHLSRNPKSDKESQLLLKQISQPFTSSRLQPNLYSLVRKAYRGLVTTRRNQSIVLHGQGSSSTKRELIDDILSYLSEKKLTKTSETSSYTTRGSSTNNPLGVVQFHDRLKALQSLVEFFSSSERNVKDNASVLYNLEFDLGCRLVGVSVQIFCLDTERLYEPPYFEVLQSLNDLSHCPVDLLSPYPLLKNLRKELLLEELEDRSSVRRSLDFFSGEMQKSSTFEMNLQKIGSIVEGFQLLGQGETFVKAVWSVFGAIYHLGCAVGSLIAMLKRNEQVSLKRSASAEKHFKNSCSLLGLSMEHVIKSLGFLDDNDDNKVKVLMGFSVGLYVEITNSIFTAINKSNSVGYRNVPCYSINVVNIGQGIDTQGRFGDLSSNYTNERIAKLARSVMIERVQNHYKTEGIILDQDSIETSNKDPSSDLSMNVSCVNVLPLLESSSAKSTKPKGLLFLIDEAKDPSVFLEKFESEFYGENEFKNLYSVDYRNTIISLCHSNGTRVVDYDVKKILKHVEIVHASKYTNLLLQESQKENINCMFLKSSSPIIGLCLSSSASEISLRRASSIRRNYSVTWKKKNASVNVKIQLDYLMDVLDRSGTHFIHCLSPSENVEGENTDLNMRSLRNQIRADSIVETLRFFKNNYPLYMMHEDFCRKFRCLASPGLLTESLSRRNLVIDIMNEQVVAQLFYRIGSTMVFMRQSVLDVLENASAVKLTPTFTIFQSLCRGFLARKNVQKMRVRDLAIRCVQKNVRKLLAVRNWSWWKMYQQLAPLTLVESSAQKLQYTLDELTSLKIKMEKTESERLRLKTENENLDIRVNELTAEIFDFETSTSIISEKLERETSEKINYETQLAQLRNYCANLEKEKQQLELDLAYSISDINGDCLDEQGDCHDDSYFKQRWERSKRELEIQKQRLKQNEQDHLDQIMVLKKSLERKCNDAYEETEEQRQIVIQLKRRIQKLGSELSDVRCLLQEESSRAALLDKKQRRFDTEIANVNSLLEKERANRDRLGREKDMAIIQVESLKNELHSLKMDLQIKESKLNNMEVELENTSQLSGTNEQMSVLRKAKNDLLMKLKDQEEELDDMAGQIQTLEGAKIRLEMQLEQMRKEAKKENQRREEEIEDLRSSNLKKMKALQCQLESDREERCAIIRSKQELERKLYDLEELTHTKSVSQEQVGRLKKELKRTKALLKDAQVLLEQSKNDALNKGMLRQLRHQLEDSESQRVRLARAKQKIEDELQDALQQLEDLSKGRTEIENSKNSLIREKGQLTSQIEELEEQLSDVMRKYKATVEQLAIEQSTQADQSVQISELESVNANLKETIAELNSKLESLEGEQVSQQIQRRCHLKVRELETRMELELTTKTRLEGQVSRLKDHLSKIQDDMKAVQTREGLALDKCRKSERQISQLKDEISRLVQKEADAQTKKCASEKQLESAELEIVTLKNDLKLSVQRIEDLTAAIRAEEMSEDEDSSTESVLSDIEEVSAVPTKIRSHLAT